MKCVFLYHANCGTGKVMKKLSYIVKRLKKRYEQVLQCETSGPSAVSQWARWAAEHGYDVVFAGGDGTFNRVLSGVAELNVNLGYLPFGTVNDIARSLHIPRSLSGALNIIMRGNAVPLDCMRIGESRYAMYIAAAGAFTEATYETPHRLKQLFGKLAYLFEAVRHHMRMRVFTVSAECDGCRYEEMQAALVFVLNGRSVAGFRINRHGSMADGTIEAVIVKQKRNPNFFQKTGALLRIVSLFLFGIGRRGRKVVFLRGKRISVRTEEDVVWDFDGEKGIKGNAEIEVRPRGVTVYLTQNKKI